MAKKKTIRYICPCCYGNIDLGQVHYSCRNPECVGTFLSQCNSAEKRRYCSPFKPDEEIDVEKTEFLKMDPRSPEAITTKEHIIRGSSNGVCDVCKGKNTTKLCPRCHTPISGSDEKEGTTIFLAMGSDGVGKSHYIASLVKTMEDGCAEEFGKTFEPASEKTTLKFDKEYRNRVFVDHKCLPPTPTYGDEDTRAPLLYVMKDRDGGESRTIAFMDTSGRDLDLTDKLAFLNVGTFIAGASGIMFFVDPLQVPGVRSKLGLPSVKDAFPNPIDVLAYVTDIVRDHNKLKPRESIDIPLAVILTKVDRLIRSPNGMEDESALFGPESSLHIDREKGKPDFVNINQIGAEIEEYLRRNIGQEFLDEVNKYERHQYFAVSAIGSEPEEGNLIKGIAPYRVEDPIIWFLNNNERRKWF